MKKYLTLIIVNLLIGLIPRSEVYGDPLFFKSLKNRPNSSEGGGKPRFFWDIFGIFGSKKQQPSSSYNSNLVSNSYGPPIPNKPSYEPPGSLKPSYGPPISNKPSYEPEGALKPSYSPPISNKPSYEPPGSLKPSYGPPISNKPSYGPPGPLKPSYEPIKPSYKPVKPSYEPPNFNNKPSYQPKPSYGPTGSTKPSYLSPVDKPSYLPPVDKPSYLPPSPTKPSYEPTSGYIPPNPSSTKPSYFPPSASNANPSYVPPASGTSKPSYLPSYTPGQTGIPIYNPPAITNNYQPPSAVTEWPNKPIFAGDFESNDNLPVYRPPNTQSHFQLDSDNFNQGQSGSNFQQSQFGSGGFQQSQFGTGGFQPGNFQQTESGSFQNGQSGSGGFQSGTSGFQQGQFGSNNFQQGQFVSQQNPFVTPVLSPCDCSQHFATASPTFTTQTTTQQTYWPTLPALDNQQPNYRPELTEIFELPTSTSTTPLPLTYPTSTQQTSTETTSSTTTLTTEINVTEFPDDPIESEYDSPTESTEMNAFQAERLPASNSSATKEESSARLEDPKAEPPSTTGDGWIPMTLQQVMEMVTGHADEIQAKREFQLQRRPKISSDQRKPGRPGKASQKGRTNYQQDDQQRFRQNQQKTPTQDFKQPRTGARSMKLDNPKTRLGHLDFKVSDVEATTTTTTTTTHTPTSDHHHHPNKSAEPETSKPSPATTVRFPIDDLVEKGLIRDQENKENVQNQDDTNVQIVLPERTIPNPEILDKRRLQTNEGYYKVEGTKEKKENDAINETKAKKPIEIKADDEDNKNLVPGGGHFDHSLNTLATLAQRDFDIHSTTESLDLQSDPDNEEVTPKTTGITKDAADDPVSTHVSILNLLGANETKWVWKLKDEDEENETESLSDNNLNRPQNFESLIKLREPGVSETDVEGFDERDEDIEFNPDHVEIVDPKLQNNLIGSNDRNKVEVDKTSTGVQNTFAQDTPASTTPTEPIKDTVTFPPVSPHLESDFVLLSDSWFSNYTSLPTISSLSLNLAEEVDFNDNEMIDLTSNSKERDEEKGRIEKVEEKDRKEKVENQLKRKPKDLPEKELVAYYPIKGKPFLSFPPDVEYASIVK